MDLKSCIETASDIVIMAGVVIALWQFFLVKNQVTLLKEQIDKEHENNRRKTAIELMQHWDINLNNKASISRKFTEKLSFEQSKNLVNQEEFFVSLDCKDLLLGILEGTSYYDEYKNNHSGKDITISRQVSSLVRWEVVTYLNSIETIFAAWRHGVADKDMIKEQFHYLISPENNHYLLADFRKAVGGNNAYPAIEDFVKEVQKEKEKLSAGKGKL